jgi:hypothetical protein
VESFDYSDLLQHLEGFDAWLTSLGLRPRRNERIYKAIEVLRRAEEVSREGRETGIYSDIRPGDWFPVIEALEAHDVFLAFRNDPSPAIAAARKELSPARCIRFMRTPRNRDGRNIWIEFARLTPR